MVTGIATHADIGEEVSGVGDDGQRPRPDPPDNLHHEEHQHERCRPLQLSAEQAEQANTPEEARGTMKARHGSIQGLQTSA